MSKNKGLGLVSALAVGAGVAAVAAGKKYKTAETKKKDCLLYTSKALKRAGMDYWKDLDVTTYLDFEDFLEKNPGAKIYYATTKAPQTYTDVHYEEDCYIMFGKESAGIPEDILVNNQETCVRIPMIGDIRSLNLSNSVAIVLYEALRQNNFCLLYTSRCV